LTSIADDSATPESIRGYQIERKQERNTQIAKGFKVPGLSERRSDIQDSALTSVS
jgi:hypothetical protein